MHDFILIDLGVEQDVKEMQDNTVITEEQPPPYDETDTTSLLQMMLTEGNKPREI
jgi:hypothetical protein